MNGGVEPSIIKDHETEDDDWRAMQLLCQAGMRQTRIDRAWNGAGKEARARADCGCFAADRIDGCETGRLAGGLRASGTSEQTYYR